jgi:hypothetical protein
MFENLYWNYLNNYAFLVFQDYSQEDTYPGYDWFSTSIFLLFRGNKELTVTFLYNIYNSNLPSIVWYSSIYSNELFLSRLLSRNTISILLPTTCHYIEHILKLELPLIFSAFRMSGLSPSQICLNWLKQCFWNYLDWPDIAAYLSICFIFGMDYQVYFCVSILKFLNERNDSNIESLKISQHHTFKDLQFYLRVCFKDKKFIRLSLIQ